MPGFCFCCLSTAEKVQIVMNNFGKLQRLNELEESEFPQFLCGRILPVTKVLQAPVSGKPCVYYEAIAEELVTKTDENGMIGIPDPNDAQKVWVPLCSEVMSADFLLIDPEIPTASVYIPGEAVPIRVLANEDAQNRSGANAMRSKCIVKHDKLPQYTKDFLVRHNVSFEDGASFRSRQIRYREANFEYGEQLAVLGIVKTVTAVNGDAVKMVKPVNKDALTEEYFKKKGWDDWERRAWLDLTLSPTIILTDMARFFQGVMVKPLPEKMTYAQIVHVINERGSLMLEGSVKNNSAIAQVSAAVMDR